MNALLSTSSSLSLFSLLSLKLPHSILCNTGLARARRKLLAGKVLDDDLQYVYAIKKYDPSIALSIRIICRWKKYLNEETHWKRTATS
jgi:hypothetical protein